MSGVPAWGRAAFGIPVLAFAAVKMALDRWGHIHPLAAVGTTVAPIGASVWASQRGRASTRIADR